MSELLARLQGDLNSARKSQDKAGTLLLSTALSEVKNKKIELRRDPTDADVIDVLRKSIKRRRESVEMYTKGNRSDLADKEAAEAAALEKYLPAQVSNDELRAAVKAAIAGGATQIGAVMGKVLPQFKGRAEGGTINAIAREELAKQGLRSSQHYKPELAIKSRARVLFCWCCGQLQRNGMRVPCCWLRVFGELLRF